MQQEACVTLKYLRTTVKVTLDVSDGVTAFDVISSALPIHRDGLKLVHKGRQLACAAGGFSAVKAGDTLLVLARPKEDETGCEPGDITLMMAQLHIDRDSAVRALRANNFDIIDAIRLYDGPVL
eukprot:gnl/Hemi2/10422_TR3598_c0_g1_i1.p1 gnl/Hemi2/10422_TR3598_c0_g1~~gnl/Hemi2/10422_TR3598_c0_g1_i1.p1  ORF type:complete len:124 (-),score=35.25 gnl/Hemi2/10422_TR3598_c0_g1_i1:54-425(-)